MTDALIKWFDGKRKKKQESEKKADEKQIKENGGDD